MARFPDELRTDRLLEKTLTAMILARVKTETAPAEDYRILYDSDEVPPPSLLLHYIFKAKIRYFADEWRRCLRQKIPPDRDAAPGRSG